MSSVWIVEQKIGEKWYPSTKYPWYHTKKKAREQSCRSKWLRTKRYYRDVV